MLAVAFFGRFEVAKEIFVMIVGMVGAVPFAALFAEALDAEVVVVLASKGTASGAAFEQSLRQGYASRDTVGFHFGQSYEAELVNVGGPLLHGSDVAGQLCLSTLPCTCGRAPTNLRSFLGMGKDRCLIGSKQATTVDADAEAKLPLSWSRGL